MSDLLKPESALAPVDDSTMEIDTTIRLYGDPVLRVPALQVEAFDSSLEDLGEQLKQATHKAEGYAVAAPQLGISLRVFYFGLSDGQHGLVVNPEWSEPQGSWMYREGCLSFPGRFWWVDRPDQVTLTYFDAQGQRHVRTDDKLIGRLWQHEVDHLRGRLVIDRLTKSHRKKAIREMGA